MYVSHLFKYSPREKIYITLLYYMIMMDRSPPFIFYIHLYLTSLMCHVLMYCELYRIFLLFMFDFPFLLIKFAILAQFNTRSLPW